MITLTEYAASWQSAYRAEADILQNALADLIITTHHIGSTSIVGMTAKPIIDIILVVRDYREFPVLEQRLLALNYHNFNRNLVPVISAICHKKSPSISFNLHIFEVNDPQIERHLNFRDFLSQNKDFAEEYKVLKEKLAVEFSHDSTAYTLNKSNLVHKIDCLAKLALADKNMPATLELDPALKPLSQQDIIIAANINIYLMLTHYAQYIKEASVTRIPGITAITNAIRDPLANNFFDLEFPPADYDKRFNDWIAQMNSSSPRSCWLNLCPQTQKLNEVLAQHAATLSAFTLFSQPLPGNMTKPPKDYSLLRELTPTVQGQASNNFPHPTINYLQQIAAVPGHATDAIQHFKIISNKQTIGQFSLVFYAKVVGLYWFDAVVDVSLGDVIALLQPLAHAQNYRTLVMLCDANQALKAKQLSLTEIYHFNVAILEAADVAN